MSVDVRSTPSERVAPTGLAAAGIGQIGAYLLAGIGIFAAFYDPNTKSRIKDGLWPTVAQFPLLWVGLLLSVLIAAKIRHESIRTLTGLRFARRDPLYVLVGVALQFAGGVVYMLVNQDEAAGKPAKELIDNARNNTLGFIVLAVAVAVGAPFVEELFYRGLVARGFQRLFQRRWDGADSGRALALSVALSGLWFAAIHVQPLQFPLLFLVGAVCAFLTLRLGRLGPAVFVHLGFNLTTVVALGLDLRSKTGAFWRF